MGAYCLHQMVQAYSRPLDLITPVQSFSSSPSSSPPPAAHKDTKGTTSELTSFHRLTPHLPLNILHYEKVMSAFLIEHECKHTLASEVMATSRIFETHWVSSSWLEAATSRIWRVALFDTREKTWALLPFPSGRITEKKHKKKTPIKDRILNLTSLFFPLCFLINTIKQGKNTCSLRLCL